MNSRSFLWVLLIFHLKTVLLEDYFCIIPLQDCSQSQDPLICSAWDLAYASVFLSFINGSLFPLSKCYFKHRWYAVLLLILSLSSAMFAEKCQSQGVGAINPFTGTRCFLLRNQSVTQQSSLKSFGLSFEIRQGMILVTSYWRMRFPRLMLA